MRLFGSSIAVSVVSALLTVAACGNDERASTGTSSTSPVGSSTPASPPGTETPPPAPPGSTVKSEVPPPPPELQVNVTNEVIDVNGLERLYTLVAPKEPGTAVRPLVLAFHGDGGNGAAMHAAYPIEKVAGDSAIIVYPRGLGGGWDLYTPPASNKDNAFIDLLIAQLQVRFAIDTTRIFAMGFSSGAFFSSQLACRKPTLLRGILVIGGGAPQEPNDPAASSWPNGYTKCAGQTSGVAAMVIHGEADGVVTVGSGEFAAKYWAYVDGCSDARATATPAPCEQHQGCPAAMPVTFCKIPGLGHEIWGPSLTVGWGFFTSL